MSTLTSSKRSQLFHFVHIILGALVSRLWLSQMHECMSVWRKGLSRPQQIQVHPVEARDQALSHGSFVLGVMSKQSERIRERFENVLYEDR